MSLTSILLNYGYIGVFIISFLGCSTIVFPIPYLLAVYYLGASSTLNPILISIASGLGATLGELTLYILALTGRYALGKESKERLEIFKKLIKRYGPIIIFIFAATPLPDDLIYPMLGVIKYDIIQTILYCFLGKTVLSTVVVYAGRFSYEFIKDFLGESSCMIVSILYLVIGIILAIVVIKIDWSKYIKLVE